MSKSHNIFRKHFLLQILRLVMVMAAGNKAGQGSPEWLYIRNKKPPDRTLIIGESFRINFNGF